MITLIGRGCVTLRGGESYDPDDSDGDGDVDGSYLMSFSDAYALGDLAAALIYKVKNYKLI